VRNAPSMPNRQYRLVVAGELSDQIGLAFEGMALSREEGNTMLVGPVRDQAELQGLLQRVSDFGLTLLSATALEDEAPQSSKTARH
jgi:hypothetical protein